MQHDTLYLLGCMLHQLLHHMHASHKCGLLLQMFRGLHVCLCMCWAHALDKGAQWRHLENTIERPVCGVMYIKQYIYSVCAYDDAD